LGWVNAPKCAPKFVPFGVKKDEGGGHGAKFARKFFAVFGLHVYAEDDQFSAKFFFQPIDDGFRGCAGCSVGGLEFEQDGGALPDLGAQG
jgi:hypothetical protein